jgi:hypothetical protein
MINHHIFKVFSNTICLAYIPETVMNCDDDYFNKLEKYKCLGNTIDGNIFNKHNDQEKKTLVKMIFLLAWNLFNSNFSVLISSCNFDVEKNSLCVYVRYE